jgi:hypothetical protein
LGSNKNSGEDHVVYLSFLLGSSLLTEELPQFLVVAVGLASILKANADDVGDATALLVLNSVFVHGVYLSLFLSVCIIPYRGSFVKWFLKIKL